MGGGTVPNNNQPFLPDVPLDPNNWTRIRNFLTETKRTIEGIVQNPNAPDQVKGLTLTTLTGGIQVAWPAANRATSYVIYRALNSNQFLNAVAIGTINRANALSFLDPTGLQTVAGHTRTYWIQPFNMNVAGPLSASATIAEPPAPANGANGLNGAMAIISNQLLLVDTATVTFSSIPQTSIHLLLVVNARITGAVANANCTLQFNSDTNSNYDWGTSFVTTGGSPVTSAGENYAQTSMTVGNVPGASASRTTQTGLFRVLIGDYTNTTFEKNVISDDGSNFGTATGSMGIQMIRGFYRTTNAITSIQLPSPSGNFKAGSRFTLYGL